MVDTDFDALCVRRTTPDGVVISSDAHTLPQSYLQTSSPARALSPETVNSICLIADAIGLDVRLQMVERYVGSELKEYRRVFRPSDEAGGLDNVSRRFAWFRRVLTRHEAEMENDKDGKRVFPDDWKVGWAMFAKFSEITREDLTVVLSKAAPTLTVQQLLDTLQPAMEFEAFVSRKWSASVCIDLRSCFSNVPWLIFVMDS